MVAMAPQRNQNSAVGAITLLSPPACARPESWASTAICTKLKYQSRPIHITPDSTCSQRNRNAHHAWSLARTHEPVPEARENDEDDEEDDATKK